MALLFSASTVSSRPWYFSAKFDVALAVRGTAKCSSVVVRCLKHSENTWCSELPYAMQRARLLYMQE